MIERIVHVRAGGFAVPFPALPQARSRLGQSGHGPRASEFASRTLPGRLQRPSRDLARAATHRRQICCDLRRRAAGAESRVRTVPRCFLPRKRANASITARAAFCGPSRDLARAATHRRRIKFFAKLSFKKAGKRGITDLGISAPGAVAFACGGTTESG